MAREWHDDDCTFTRGNPFSGESARPCSCGFWAETLSPQAIMQDELFALASGMDVPRMRWDDVAWLGRNLGINNRDHKDFPRAMELIRLLQKSG
jgi:hypothetical protein